MMASKYLLLLWSIVAFNEYINGMSAVVRALYESKSSGIGSLIARSERQVTKALGNFAKKWEKLP